MIIARIVSSNSHIDYIGRVIDALDTADPPAPDEHGFGRFVSMNAGEGSRTIGVIYDSVLVNPDYANYGPRLSAKNELRAFSPDHLNEQGMLIGILLLGSIDENGLVSHGIPRRIVPPGTEVEAIPEDLLRAFHRTADGSVQIKYYSQLMSHAGNLGLPLMESIISRLAAFADENELKRLTVLKNTLSWQRTVGGMRL